jgi:hypothetical protein
MKHSSTLFATFMMLMITGLLSIQLVLAQKITFSDPLNKAGFTLKEQTRGGVSVGYSIKSFTIAPAEINGKGMSNIELDGNWLPNDEGAPNLPGGGRYIAIPQGAVPVLKIVSQRTESYKNIDVAPAFKIPLDTDKSPLQYPTRTDIYSSNAFYPASPVTLSAPSKIRGVDVVMLGITPFQYNPVTKELVVYRDLEIEVEFQGGTGQFGEDRLRSRFWDPILSDALLNYQSIPVIDYSKRAIENKRGDGCEYLIIIPDGPDFLTWAEQIKSFRIRQGITTEIRTLTDIGGNNATIIKNYISNVYNTWDPVPSAIMLMADYGSNQNSTIISPIWDSYCASDNIYADVDNDDMPEFAMGRMVANNNTELETMVTKFLNYETNPPTSAAFYDHPITALGWQTVRWFQLCSEIVGGYFKNVQGKNPVRINEVYEGNPNSDPWSTATNTQTIMDEFGPNGLGYIPGTPQELGGWSGGDANDINAAVNAGAFILQHRDHGMETGWGEPSYVNFNIDGLTNTDLTYVFSINCLTGKYNWSSECFVEKFYRYRHNNVNSGALAVLGASETSYSFVNDTYLWGVYDNMWPDFMPEYSTTPAERGLLPSFANAAGKYFLQQSGWPYNTENKEVTYNLFHHFGDAFLTLYSEVPQDLTIIHDGIILSDMDQFIITADEGSTICLTVDDNIIGLAQGTGSPLTMTITPQEAGTTALLTVTKTNYFRHQEPIAVIPPEGAYCLYDAYTVSDDNGGNGNGLADYNETVELNLGIKNVGMVDGDSITVTITTLDPFITLFDNSEFYGVIPSGQSVTIDNGFSFYAAENTPDQHEVIFSVICSNGVDTWNSVFTVKVNAPLLNINSLIIDDHLNGNGDGKLDPGEQVTMTLNYSNTGHATAYDVDVFLEGQSGYIDIANPNQNFSSIGFLGLFNKDFDVTVDAASPEGISVNFVNELTMGNFYQEKIFSEKVSALYEDFETGNFTKFNWLSDGDVPWEVSNVYPYQGFFSARSGTIGASQNSVLKISYNVMSGDSIVFIRKVSSEPADRLQFYVGTQLMGEWSGVNEGWRREAFYVTPGNKTFKWVYAKNGSTNGGSDRGWLDNIVLPPAMCLTLWAGPDVTICPGDQHQIQESYGTGYNTVEWTTSGTGAFDDNSQIQPVYFPSDEDIATGNVNLTMTLTDSEGNIVTDDMVLTINDVPEAPPTAEGPDYIDLFVTTSSNYSTTGIPDINDYNWYLEPVESGAIQGSGLTSTVTWNPEYLGMAYITASALGQCGEGAVSTALAVTVDNTVGIRNPENHDLGLEIFPNPGDGLYNIRLSSGKPDMMQLKLTNVLGKTILDRPIQLTSGSDYQLNLESLPAGVYFLNIKDNAQQVTKKLVKK